MTESQRIRANEIASEIATLKSARIETVRPVFDTMTIGGYQRSPEAISFLLELNNKYKRVCT